MSIFDRFREKSESKRKAEKERKAELREVILGLQRNQLTIKETLFGKVSGPDASKLGGKPYLPADFAWPTYKSVEDGITRPLSFFCQFNLEKVKSYDKDNLLPARGMLYFFYDCASSAWGYDPADEGAARVFYFENTDGFVPLDLPQELPEDLPPREDFFAVVRAGFGQRRKTMLNSLSAGLRWEKDATRALLTAAGIAENARAEQVTMEQWKALTRAYFSMKKSR